MKKKIAIFGSTGSIGTNTLQLVKKNKNLFCVNLLTTNTNVQKIFKQAKEFNVKNIIISDLISYRKAKIMYRKSKINIFCNFDQLNKILRTKNDLIMCSITGLNGLLPTIKSIRHTKKILIANKESIICGWNLIEKELKKYKTDFIPIDSEHFSIWSILRNYNSIDIERIYITASGGPFLTMPKNQFSNISVSKALRHPNWQMGKKISIDSATLMNKVFEVIEAKNIFKLEYKKIFILTHPKSYVHAIIKFKNGLTKIIVHDPDMQIPIFNSIHYPEINSIRSKPLNINLLNNLDLRHVNTKKFPLVKLLNKLPNNTSLFETILITINDYFVLKFLDKKINFQKLIHLIYKISNLKEFDKFKKIKPKNLSQIYKLRDFVSLKLDKFSI
jgi:1-deoxy-D-xylulose-5-phosphate reductoisomerase